MTVHRWTMVPPLAKKRNLGAYALVRGPVNSFRDGKCLNFLCDASNHLDESIRVDLLCGAPIFPVQDDDECEAHAASLVESEGFGILDTGGTTSFGSVEAQRLCSPRVMKMIHEFQMLIRLVVDRSNLEMVLRHRLHLCPDSQFEMMLLVTSGFLAHLFSDQPKPTPLMLGMDFLKEHRCVVNYGEDFIQFPMQPDCWWPLFVSSRGLYSMPLCGQR